MARGPRTRLLSRPAKSDIEQNGDPPQSTLAAQLVQQFTVGQDYSKFNNEETFQQLLQEVLGANTDQPAAVEALKNDVGVNSKLIYVIAKAGLESLSLRNYLDKNLDSYQRVTDSLAAIKSTIKKCPNVLFVQSPDVEIDSNDHGQLFQWLLPKLFSLLAKSKNVQNQEALADLLKSCMMGGGKSLSNTSRYGLIMAYIQGCTRGSLHPCLAK